MKSDFLNAIAQLAAEKNLPKEVVFEAVEAALVSAYRKDNFAPNQDIAVKVTPQTGEVKVFAQKTVVDEVTDPRTQVSLAVARRIKSDATLGNTIMVESTPGNAGRIAAQTAKQVVLQRLREAERDMVFEEFADKGGDILSAQVQRVEPSHVILNLGRAEAILPASEQVPNERYRPGQRLKVYLMGVNRISKGPQVVVSRTHRNLLRRLFELEVPEIFNGIVEVKAIAREAGSRSKVAVWARQEGVDPVGSCVGPRGIRIHNIVEELGGERVDVVSWHPDPSIFVANALSPAQVISVKIDEDNNTAYVVVPDRQLSLAIGREGQNARLAARLTGLRVDIRSQSMAAAEEQAKAEEMAEPSDVTIAEETLLLPTEPVALATGDEVTPPRERERKESTPLAETAVVLAERSGKPPTEKPRLRFAEEILAPTPATREPSGKKASSKKGQPRQIEETTDRVKTRRERARPLAFPEEEEDEAGKDYKPLWEQDS